MSPLQLELFENNLEILNEYFTEVLETSPEALLELNFIKTHTPECIIVVCNCSLNPSTFVYTIDDNEEITFEEVC